MSSPETHWQRFVPLNGADDISSKPLGDVVVCFTSVDYEKRIQWEKYAREMGAVNRADLTGDVTHLVVGKHDTPKYQYVAKERPDVQPMTTEWIEAVRELWINDKEIDVKALEKEHTLPTLATLKLSMTGCDDPTERFEIVELVKSNGGVYEGDLTKQITHLISFRTEGAKYKAAKNWGLRIVSIEWLRDSLERGMILNEALYDPVLPIEKRGISAWDKTKPRRTSLGKRSREDSVASMDGGKRKLRRTASTKLSSKNKTLWADISGGSMAPQVMRSGVWETANEQTPKGNELQQRIPARASSISPKVAPVVQPVIKGIFGGCRFYLAGFIPKRTQVLGDHLYTNGGVVAITMESLLETPQEGSITRLFRIIPSDVLESESPTPPQSDINIETVTEMWVERCLYGKKIMEPSEHVIGRPFPKFPLEGFKDLTISSAAFGGIDLLHLQKAVRLIGATYSEDFTPQSSILVTKSVIGLRKDKSDHAKEWKVPVVDATWLWDCIAAGEKLSDRSYRLKSPKRSGSVPSAVTCRQRQAERSRSHIARSFSNPPGQTANPSKLLRNSRLDKTAFMDDDLIPVKQEVESQMPQPTTTTSNRPRSEPLSEISNTWSPSRTVSTAPAPSDHPAPRPQQDLSRNISDLLAKTKKSTQPRQNEALEGRRRAANRILGRVTSNISTTSSADSTAMHSHFVEPNGSDKTASAPSLAEYKQLEQFMDAGNDRTVEEDVDNQPPSTQLQYDDPDSREYQERVAVRLGGGKDGKKPPLLEKAITLGNMAEQSKPRGGRKSRAPPGFR